MFIIFVGYVEIKRNDRTNKRQVAEHGEVFTAERTTRIGVIPIGYADGLNRHLSERGFKVWLNGSMVPIVYSPPYRKESRGCIIMRVRCGEKFILLIKQGVT